LILGVIPNSYC